jgi:hypothetical protein
MGRIDAFDRTTTGREIIRATWAGGPAAASG